MTAKIYRVWRKTLDRHVFNVVYYLGGKRQIDQRGTLTKATERARFQVAAIAAGKPSVAEATQHDLDELAEARRRAGEVSVLLALEEWSKARSLVGAEIIAACEDWTRRLTKFQRISVFEAAEKFKAAMSAKQSRKTSGATGEQKGEISKSYKVVLKSFQSNLGERYFDDLEKLELDAWFAKHGKSGWTHNPYRKRIVTLFRWALGEHWPCSCSSQPCNASGLASSVTVSVLLVATKWRANACVLSAQSRATNAT